MFSYDKPLLNDKQRERINKIKVMLSTGINPYDTGEVTTKVKSVSHANTNDSKERLATWLASNKTPKGAGKWSVDLDEVNNEVPVTFVKIVPSVVEGLTCIACSIATEVVSSIYGRINNGVATRVMDTYDQGVLIERTVIKYSSFITGYVCGPCSDRLYALKYYDKHDVLRRGLEILDAPIVKVKESYRKGHRELTHTVPETPLMRDHREDRLPRGRESVVSVTAHHEDVVIGGVEYEECWKAELPAREMEYPDPSCVAKFTRMGRKVG